MSTPDQEPTFSEQFLRLMNDRPNEDIVGTPEWQEKVFRLADKCDANERSSLKKIRNIGLGVLAVSAAAFGIDQAIDIFPQAVAVGTLGIGGSSGLGAAIGAQLHLSRL